MTVTQKLDVPPGIPFTWKEKRHRHHWPYKAADGTDLGFKVRYEDADGNKVVIPYFKRNGTQWKTGYEEGIRLEHVLVGRRYCTSVEALCRFTNGLAEARQRLSNKEEDSSPSKVRKSQEEGAEAACASPAPSVRKAGPRSSRRETAINEAHRALEKEGI